MDWDWKEFAWDSSGLELELSNDGFGAQKNGGEASVDLRLGEASSDLVEKSKSTTPDTPKNPKGSKIASSSSSSSPSGSSKRTRLQNGSQNMNCLVDGCNSDLSDCREYHRRHRVCEKHSKTPVVLVGGKQQRFCQQCSRFHSLGEFDEVKRSCRKRLDGHNRRRRKPQPPSLFMAAEKFLYNYKGPRILQFGDPQTYANPIMRNMWPATAKTGAEPVSYDHQRLLCRIEQQSLLSSFANVQHKRDKELPLLQQNGPRGSNGNETVSETSIFQPIRGTIAPAANGKGSHQKPSSDSKPGSFDSGCALYLLSTLQTQSSELSLVQSSITCPTQSTSGAVHFDAVHEYSSSERSKDKPNGSVLVLDANSTNPHCNGMLRMGPDGLVENGDSLTLPFFWE